MTTTTTTFLDFFVDRFSDLFFPCLGVPEVDVRIPVVFAGPCDLLNQLVLVLVKCFKGFVARRKDYGGDFLR